MTSSTYNYINLDYLDLMADGDLDMKKTMLEMLLDELPEEIEKVVSLAKSGDMKTLKAVTHKLKSTLAFVGYESMDSTNKQIEKIAMKEAESTPLVSLSEQMGVFCEQVLVELKSELNKL